MSRLPSLHIGDIEIQPPIIQGGMGVRVSMSSLASAVSNSGALGVIASVGLGDEKESEKDYAGSSNEALRLQIRKAKALTKRPFGVNIMYALSNYDDLVRVCVEEEVGVIFSGAGIPLKLPSLVKDSKVKIAPIVSSDRAADLICRAWKRKYDRVPDAIVVEGPLAGGHLGFSLEELGRIDDFSIEKIFVRVKDTVSTFEKQYGVRIPIVAGGGIFSGKDIARMIRLGADGVQMATRFVCTNESDASQAYKDVYLKARKEDVIIINSPVGLPGRAIKNRFVERILNGEKIRFRCPYKCLKTCEPASVNYCIADALVNASKGDFENGFAMSGANVHRIDKIVSVKELIGQLAKEAEDELSRPRPAAKTM